MDATSDWNHARSVSRHSSEHIVSDADSCNGVRDILARYHTVPVAKRKYSDFLPVARFELSRHGFPQREINALADLYAHTLHSVAEQRGLASVTQAEKDRLLQEVLNWSKRETEGHAHLAEIAHIYRSAECQ